MNTTAVYPVRGGYMVIAYRDHGFAWTVTVEGCDESAEVARQWRHYGIRPEGAKS